MGLFVFHGNDTSRLIVQQGVERIRARSIEELVKQIMNYIKQYNEHTAHPFKWTYSGKVLVA